MKESKGANTLPISGAFQVVWPLVWPLPDLTQILHFDAPNGLGQIRFNAWPDGRLGLVYTDNTGNTLLSCTTEAFRTTGVGEMLIIYSLEPPDVWTLWLNKTQVKGAHDPDARGCTIALDPVIIDAPLSVDAPGARTACERMMRLRKSKLPSQAPAMARRTLSLDEELQNLEERLANMKDDLVAVGGGNRARWHSLRATLRELVCNQGGKNYNPLLQRVAAMLDQPLPMYASEQVKVAVKFDTLLEFAYFGLKKNKESNVLVDLDQWLQRSVIRHQDEGGVDTYTFNRLIAQAAEVLGGAHASPEIRSTWDTIRGMRIADGGNALDRFLFDLAVMTGQLGTWLLSRRSAKASQTR